MNNKSLIKNVKFNDINGEITYETVTITDEFKLGDLDDITLNVSLSDNGKELIVSKFNVLNENINDDVITYEDAMILKNALTEISFNMETGILGVSRLGEFWNV